MQTVKNNYSIKYIHTSRRAITFYNSFLYFVTRLTFVIFIMTSMSSNCTVSQRNYVCVRGLRARLCTSWNSINPG